MRNKVLISIIIPVYGCCKSLRLLYERLEKTLSTITENFEIIMINDASPDNSWSVIQELSKKDKRVKGINFSRNFGQHYAITAGIDYAQGDWVVVMDCDLQDQPEEIIKLYNKAQEGYDVVLAQRIEREDSFFKKIGSKIFYKVLSYLTGTEQDASIANFGIYHKKVINAVKDMNDYLKYFPVMVRWVGFKLAVMPVKHSKRYEGESSYSLFKLLSLSIDVMLSFSDKPLKIVVKLGFFISLTSLLISVILFMLALLNYYTVPGWASTMITLWLLSGLIMMIQGIVGIYVGKTFDQTKNRPTYIIKEII